MLPAFIKVLEEFKGTLTIEQLVSRIGYPLVHALAHVTGIEDDTCALSLPEILKRPL